jgi:hypothetical protein
MSNVHVTTKQLVVITNNSISVGVIIWIKIGGKIMNFMGLTRKIF